MILLNTEGLSAFDHVHVLALDQIIRSRRENQNHWRCNMRIPLNIRPFKGGKDGWHKLVEIIHRLIVIDVWPLIVVRRFVDLRNIPSLFDGGEFC